jgi:AcrR family transcriptional regulator
MATRPYHHGNLRSALLERAEATLREGGPDELSLRRLARDVGVSHAAPRRHFTDRQALLDALAEDGFIRVGAVWREAVEAAGPGFAPRLAALARAHVRFATHDAALLELMFAGKHRAGSDAPAAAAEEAFRVPLELFARAGADGEIATADPERTAIVVFGTIQGLAALSNLGMLEGRSLDSLVDAAVAQLLAGLLPRPGG